jgi:hypothetical protein
MKTSFFLLLFLTASTLFAQSNLSIFNNNGQQFYVVLNGIRQNSKPETNVQVGQIKNGSYAVKVIFADGKTPDIDKNFMIDAPYDITARIIFKKGKGKLQLIGQEPTHGVIQEAVVYRPSDAAVYSDAVVVNSIQTTPTSSSTTTQTTGTGNATGINMNVNIQETPNTTIQSSHTTTTTTTTGTIPDENVNLNMNLSVGGVNVNLNANATGTGLGAGTTVSETTSTTTTTSSATVSSSSSSTTSGVGLNSNININQSGVNQTVQGQTNTQVLQQQQQQQQQQVLQNQQQGHFVNCTQTMNRLEAFKAELQDQSFEDDRLEALKLGLNKTCLTTAQSAQLLDLFTFDENRLEAAKYLSDRLTDRANAGELAKKLTFDSSKMEYRRYISE